MKTVTRIIALLFIVSLPVSAQDSPYQKAMKKEIAAVLHTDSLPQLQRSANAFARIAELNPTEWQPAYYQALACTFQSFNKTLALDKKDEVLAMADELIKKADALSPGNAEIITMQAFVTIAKLSADPAGRGQSLSGVAMQTLGKSMAIDSKNPRTLVLTAQMEFGMAQFFGSGTEKACGLAKQSLAIFSAQDEEALKAALLPTWGKNQAEGLVGKCK
ncbi:hypothetical protein GCM10010967_35640 [Dyadobacter beijingensis]|uniref:Uncharacterized protein n=1 Tax=Dyadobacter beijingensis TaxID=365489 RepID=A0ABQ2I2K2_9BACT|nr:hypothetical protein [Dyadobacter beijingensis]GGM98642.1 hypothetical protein GCM10010967_35640 [Dyadobacter beijingensis]